MYSAFMLEEAVLKLKTAGLIKPDDIVVACTDIVHASAGWGGWIGVAIAAKNLGHYLLSANRDEIRLFDVDKKTGEYLETYSPILKSEIIKAWATSYLRGKYITVKTDGDIFRFFAYNKFKGYNQKNGLVALKVFLKENYSKKK